MTTRMVWHGIVRGLPAVPVLLFWSASKGFSGDASALRALEAWCNGHNRPHQLGAVLSSASLAGWASDPYLAAEAAHNVLVEGYERIAMPELGTLELPSEQGVTVRI